MAVRSGPTAMRVLVVEDHRRIAQFLERGLVEEGFAVCAYHPFFLLARTSSAAQANVQTARQPLLSCGPQLVCNFRRTATVRHTRDRASGQPV
jgi:hypothetical protein